MVTLTKTARAFVRFLNFALVVCYLFITSCEKQSFQANTAQAPIVHVVEINKFKFQPETISVRKGYIVQWTNKDIVPHQIEEKASKEWRSEELLPQDSFTLSIVETTKYICKLHPTMRAKIIVQRR